MALNQNLIYLFFVGRIFVVVVVIIRKQHLQSTKSFTLAKFLLSPQAVGGESHHYSGQNRNGEIVENTEFVIGFRH